jgi:hypothetical protein
MESITRNSPGPRVDSSLRPNCSSTAVKMVGPAGGSPGGVVSNLDFFDDEYYNQATALVRFGLHLNVVEAFGIPERLEILAQRILVEDVAHLAVKSRPHGVLWDASQTAEFDPFDPLSKGRFDLSILCKNGHEAERANKYQETHKTPAALYLLSDNPLIPDTSLPVEMCARLTGGARAKHYSTPKLSTG